MADQTALGPSNPVRPLAQVTPRARDHWGNARGWLRTHLSVICSYFRPAIPVCRALPRPFWCPATRYGQAVLDSSARRDPKGVSARGFQFSGGQGAIKSAQVLQPAAVPLRKRLLKVGRFLRGVELPRTPAPAPGHAVG